MKSLKWSFLVKAIFVGVAILGTVEVCHVSAEEMRPCKQKAKEVVDAMKTAKLTETRMQEVMDLRMKGIWNCRVQNDEAANKALNKALKLLGK